jgi:hypothetical protein
MPLSRAVVSEWYWAGGPNRRFLVSLLATFVIVIVPYLAGNTASRSLIGLFLGWDLGSWFMDRVYVDRISRRAIEAH